MQQWVEIQFDCLPLRSVARLDVPVDASPKYREKCLRIKDAIERHGRHNTYYLHNAVCKFHLTNRADVGYLEFVFEGTVLTDGADRRSGSCDLEARLVSECCDWLTEPALEWFKRTVRQAVMVEFDRYIEAGDLERTKKRLDELQAATDQSGGYVGMYL